MKPLLKHFFASFLLFVWWTQRCSPNFCHLAFVWNVSFVKFQSFHPLSSHFFLNEFTFFSIFFCKFRVLLFSDLFASNSFFDLGRFLFTLLILFSVFEIFSLTWLTLWSSSTLCSSSQSSLAFTCFSMSHCSHISIIMLYICSTNNLLLSWNVFFRLSTVTLVSKLSLSIFCCFVSSSSSVSLSIFLLIPRNPSFVTKIRIIYNL